jgi:Tfp pilus assembly protein PilN
MRELEFLPDWYPRLRRQRRMVILQGWVTLAVVIGLAMWLTLARRNVRHAEAALSAFEVQIRQTETEKRQLDEQLRMKAQLEQRAQVVASLGFPVEMSRVLRTLDVIMPREMSLKDVTCTTEELHVAPQGAALGQALSQEKPRLDRRLKVRLVGVAPDDVDLANFLAGLTNYPFFEQIALLKADGVVSGGHAMREFEVTFSMSLNTPPGQ